jgi:hypothetical protein
VPYEGEERGREGEGEGEREREREEGEREGEREIENHESIYRNKKDALIRYVSSIALL